MQKIAVIGATGMIGRPVTEELVKAGFEVTIITRNVQKAARMFPGVNVVYGDIFKTVTLVKALTDQDAVYLNLSPQPENGRKGLQPEREGIDNIIKAARANKLKRVVYLSSLIKNYNITNRYGFWVFNIKLEAIERIKRSGLAYTIFNPSGFYENFMYSLMDENNIVLGGESNTRLWFISGEDYGQTVAAALKSDAAVNKEFTVQGPESYTWDEAANIFIEHYKKKKLAVKKTSMRMLKFLSFLNKRTAISTYTLEAWNNYPEKFESDITWHDLHHPSLTLSAYAAKMSNKRDDD
jgi:uncharacterized protein YbjT (DUF2867 family)